MNNLHHIPASPLSMLAVVKAVFITIMTVNKLTTTSSIHNNNYF